MKKINDDLCDKIIKAIESLGDGPVSAPVSFSDSEREECPGITGAIETAGKRQKNLDFLDKLPSPVMTIDTDYTITYMNEAGAEFVGRSAQEAIGLKCYDLFRTTHCGTKECRCSIAMARNTQSQGETVANPRDEEIPIKYTAVPLKDTQGGIKGALEQFIDISDNREIINNLEELKLNYEKQMWITEGVNGVYAIARGETDMRKLSKKICSYLAKYLEAQIITFYIMEDEMLYLKGSYAFKMRKSLGDKIEPGEGLTGQAVLENEIISITDIPEDYTRINSSIGDSPPRNVVVAPFSIGDKVYGVVEIGAFQELDNRKLEMLDTLKEPLATIIRSIAEQNRTKTLLEKTKKQSSELENQREELKAANESLKEQTDQLKQSEEELKQQSEELQASNEELEEKQNLLEKQKEEIERSKKAVEKQAKKVEASSQYKSEFLANMSHELRTPLNSLLLLSKNLAENRNGNLDEDEVEDARIIYEGGNNLLNLINDIMDLSKVEAGKLTINSETVNLKTVTENLKKIFAPVAKKKELSFDIHIDQDVPSVIKSDEQRLEQILKNFLSNAFKFTREGNVRLEISISDKGEAVEMSVTDTGIGIPEDKQQEIFEAFQQQDGSTSRKYGGTGLGLTISRELTELLGGEVALQSKEGEGSTFILTLPLKSAGKPETPEKKRKPQKEDKNGEAPPRKDLKDIPSDIIPDDRKDINPRDRMLLIIEDDPDFARTLYKFSRKNDYKCLVAGDGKTGIILAKEYEPDGILLDLGLPDINGEEVLEQLKYSLKTRHIPVQIISGREKDASSAKINGAIGYLKKPVSRDDLDSIIDRIETENRKEIRKILFVEDDEGNIRAVRELFNASDIEMKSVNTAREGLEEIERDGYDCVILDLGLPDMSGFELIEKLRENDGNELPPIIVYTGKELTEEQLDELDKYTSSIVIKGSESYERLLDDVSLFLHSVESKLEENKRNTLKMLHDEDAMLRGRKILLVDDDMRNNYAMSRQIMGYGLDVDMSKNGQEAVNILQEDDSYELILMDIMMPVMDGFEATKRIRKMDHYRNVPIIALTAKAMPQDRDKCLEAGASEYLTKPVDFDKLMSLLRIFLFKRG